jgi:hypothetical protein
MCADMWAVCLRMDVNHRDDDTTSICEGFHSALKGLIRSLGSESLRLDRLLYYLLRFVAEVNVHRDARRFWGINLLLSKCHAC